MHTEYVITRAAGWPGRGMVVLTGVWRASWVSSDAVPLSWHVTRTRGASGRSHSGRGQPMTWPWHHVFSVWMIRLQHRYQLVGVAVWVQRTDRTQSYNEQNVVVVYSISHFILDLSHHFTAFLERVVTR